MNFIIFILIGVLSAMIFDFKTFIYDSAIFDIFSSIALLIGLYGSVYGIERQKLLENKNIIGLAVTIGVILKILIIGLFLYIITGQILSFLLATIIAQIDPLSVSSLENNKLSPRGNSILSAWASFDDPMTIIISLWISSTIIGIQFDFINMFTTLGKDIFLNFLLATITFLLYTKIKNQNLYQLFLLMIVFLFSLVFKLFLGIAIVAIFLRPKIDKEINFLIKIALAYVSIIMGILIVGGVNVYEGIILGILTVIAQFITSWILTKDLLFTDRIQLSIAQQSGITAITLAVYFSHFNNMIVGTISIAIITINSLYFILNYIYTKYYMTDVTHTPTL